MTALDKPALVQTLNARVTRDDAAVLYLNGTEIWRDPNMPAGLITNQTPVTTSIARSKELKKQGWMFVGPTTVYAFMQAMGLINDHVEGCEVRAKVEAARTRFQRPVR